MSTPDKADIERKCTEIIDRHAHRALIREDDMRAWVKEVVGKHGEMATWHAVRAGGFGGSEIGVLVRNHMGHRADHQASAHDIVAGKLLRMVPSEETGDLRRGHKNEPLHAAEFYAKYATRRDQESFDRLSRSSGLRTWMRYSPDDVVLLPSASPNPALGGAFAVRYLIDYKAPRQVDQSDTIAFQYACQLTQGAMICAKEGIHLDGLMLSQFDWAHYCLKDDAVGYSPELAQQILLAGDHYWDGFVMRGQLPAYVSTPRFEGEKELQQEWAEKATRLAQMKAMEKAIGDGYAALEEDLKGLLAQHRLAGQRLALGELSISAVTLIDHEKVHEAVAKVAQSQGQDLEECVKGLAKKGSYDYDKDAMVKKLREMGVDLAPFRSVKFDDAKAFDWLAEHDLDAQAFMKEQIRMSPSASLKDQAAQVVRATYGSVESGEGSPSAASAQRMAA